MGFLKKFTKQEISWMMYDWANSAHSVIVVTILPIFFDSVASCTADSVSSMSTWGYATSIAMAIVALAAPFLGVFGDIRGMRKKLFTAFLLLGVVSVAGLAFTPLMDFASSTAAAAISGDMRSTPGSPSFSASNTPPVMNNFTKSHLCAKQSRTISRA